MEQEAEERGREGMEEREGKERERKGEGQGRDQGAPPNKN